jgi:flagellar motility protein MotE (MotC chaperone)
MIVSREIHTVPYLLLAALAAALLLFVWRSQRRWLRRERAIRALLDGADALEAQLQDCRQRMQRLRGMLTILPEEMSADADGALSADAKVKLALKDVLAHRLWIKQHAADASLQQLDAARGALSQSGATLRALIERLTAITNDLERAQSSAQTVSPRGKMP